MPTAVAKIRWTAHALKRLRSRGISRNQVLTLIRRALEAGDLRPGDNNRLQSGGLKVAVDVGKRGNVSVITVMNRGRKRGHRGPPGPKLRYLKARATKRDETHEEE